MGRAVVVLAFVSMAGCGAKDQLPTLTEIRGHDVPNAARNASDLSVHIRAELWIQRIDLPLDQPTDAAWAVADEGAFPAVTRSVWNANGLRIGLLSRIRHQDFTAALPPSTGQRRSRLLGGSHPLPIRKTPRLHGSVTVDLTIPPMAVHEERVTGGRLQLLTRVMRDAVGRISVDLLPHHHLSKSALERAITQRIENITPNMLDKSLEGRFFNELALRVAVPRSHLLVVGLFRPWPEPPPAVRALAVESPEGEPISQRSDDPAQASDRTTPNVRPTTKHAAAGEPPPLQNHLGRALMTAPGHPTQMILLISVEPR